ncbi:MAG TPA: divalent-cation tolerance protein CutA [Syntrophorhabdaceae bacterium]|nr:divalent-cation tolerance protein CutA [Syntrophorhabdaceae bacterium]HOL05188.1 divalent-cation tolerance protein CutA [Syntrophorhabdaceae bacterium]HON84767.1 divalent-cation tolerance protein CutA [Syntrophorhabdaceae bacterium]HPC66294.1 divalent-cation tolerance protein CutA [Syntrophorhabdaceae bacterium]HPP41397.1 divalent-cation tolerance protein CutA [Syntrophorhabdaceae bacterium]
MEEYIQISTTTDTIDIAEAIAKRLVESRLAACVQIIGPIKSIYWWQGDIEASQEWLCLIKSTKGLFRDVEDAIKAVHPYKVPEIVAVPIINGSDDYINWIGNEVKK